MSNMKSWYLFIITLVIFLESIKCAKRVKRIIGGEDVPTDAFPVAVSIKNKTSEEHLCGGILIKYDAVITAAHCVEFGNPGNYSIKLENIHIVNDNLINANATVSDVLEINKHHLYKRQHTGHDIALLKLKEQYHNLNKANENILPQSSFGLTGECQIYGYGATEMNSEKTFNNLKVGTVSVISNDECITKLGSYLAPKPGSGMVCALGNSTDACLGDSGSPMMCNGILEGIVSYGMGCGINNNPGVYTRVALHMDWISSVLNIQ